MSFSIFDFPKCPTCGNHLEDSEETSVEDWNDPGDPNGHGQREYKIMYCPSCGETVEEEI